MQVCVPAAWTDEEVERFAEVYNPSGTSTSWHIRTEPRLLNGDPIRQPCNDHAGFVHITLDA